jgi:hypothetical protein
LGGDGVSFGNLGKVGTLLHPWCYRPRGDCKIVAKIWGQETHNYCFLGAANMELPISILLFKSGHTA